MKEFEYVVQDKQGIHARPAGILVKAAADYPCSVVLIKDGKEVDAKRIFGLMSLGVKCGDKIMLRTEGELEEEAIVSSSEFIQENL